MLGDTYQLMLFIVIIVKGGEGEVVGTNAQDEVWGFHLSVLPIAV